MDPVLSQESLRQRVRRVTIRENVRTEAEVRAAWKVEEWAHEPMKASGSRAGNKTRKWILLQSH